MWPRRPDRQPLLIEVSPSRWDDEPIMRSRAMLSGLVGSDGLSLEFAAKAGELRFYVRAIAEGVIDAALGQLRAAYPQAGARRVSLEERPYLDPARAAPGEMCYGLALRLTGEAALPLGTDARRGDPLKGVLAAAASARGGERLVTQLLLSPAPSGWAEGVRRRGETRARGRRDEARPAQTGDMLPVVGLLGLSALGLQGYEWYQQGDMLLLAGTGAGTLIGLPLAAALAMRFLRGREDIASDLVKEKLAYPAFTAQLRVLALAPDNTNKKRLESLAGRVAAAYQAFEHPLGNSLKPQSWRGDPQSLNQGRRFLHKDDILNAAEVAALWHLPDITAGLAVADDASARRILPAEDQVGRGCRVGVAVHQETAVPAYMPPGLLFRNQLVVAKTRRGKSTLLVHKASYLMQRLAEGRERLLLVVVDPHQDLAEAVLGLVPAVLEDRVTYLNLADRQRPVGLNLLDVALFPDRDRTAENVVTMMHRLWPDNWGPRMENALRASLMCLHEANQARRREDQYTLLDVLPMLSSADFRQEVMQQVPDRALWVSWRDNYDNMGRAMQQQIANPVTTKVGRFLVSEASRFVVGQPSSTWDPRPLLKEGGVLVVNSAVGLLGEGAAALVGATVLNLLGLVVEEQVSLPPSQRSRLVALVDESSTLGAADYPRMLSELGKYGASFVLVTQSLAKLDAIDEALRPTVFSNVDGLMVFQVSAQDARYLAPELGGDLDVADLTALDDFECYARWWADGRRLPTFSLRLDPPPPTSPDRLQAVAERSAQRYGRPREEVAREIEAILAKRPAPVTSSQRSATSGRSGQATPSAQTPPTEADREQRATEKADEALEKRNQHRDRR